MCILRLDIFSFDFSRKIFERTGRISREISKLNWVKNILEEIITEDIL